MEKKLSLQDRLKHFIESDENLNVIRFAKKYDFKPENVYKWQKGTIPSDAYDLIKLESILNKEENIKKEVVKQEVVQENTADNNMYNKTICHLAEGNRMLAESNKTLSESNLHLTLKVTAKTEHEPLGIPSVLVPKFVSLMKLIAKAGAQGWKSEAEALADINNIFYADLAIKKEVDIEQH